MGKLPSRLAGSMEGWCKRRRNLNPARRPPPPRMSHLRRSTRRLEKPLRRMVDPELLKLLCCPETYQELRLADPALLEELNRKVVAGGLRNRSGRVVSEKLASGLVRADGKRLYPIRNNIPVMLVDEG